MKCGFVAVVGRPNIGKSTLVNALAGEKASIVSRRRQTTRGVVRAVCNCEGMRIMLLDSPGWQNRRTDDFARTINGGAEWAAESADVAIFMTTPRWTAEDAAFLSRLSPRVPTIAAINKTDLVKDGRELLPFVESLRQKHDFAAIVPLSALYKKGLRELQQETAALLPDENAPFATDFREDENFVYGELLREKLMRMLDGEMPYRVGVLCRFDGKTPGGLPRIRAEVYAERNSQKAVILGRGGTMLTKIASAARFDIERHRGEKIFLAIRVLVRPQWRRNPRLLTQMRIGTPDS